MKRVVAITVIMVMVTSLFTFSVFADTPVQPLQVITYSDTTTNVRISGTAERLHYNIDSFQVVFMNPPNNYGTACTPVLVSFRFYNASDIPAYVGQPEFELTATTGTGSVNTIIYGYDQISTDLFVAESSYSTADVGRIGIGASNDFAYYTGFVIPPRTSLYFSCIVYVNASAYGQNNTGAVEDVNQVTLSSLNLYSNQISFSDDYPYHNEPVDFSEIINAISDLSSTVSTSSELQSIIAALSGYSQHINSTVVQDNYVSSVANVTLYNDNTNNVSIRAYAFLNGYTTEFHEFVDQLSGDTTRYTLYDIPVIITYRIFNGSNKAFAYSPWYKDITWTMTEPNLTKAGLYVEKNFHEHLNVQRFSRNNMYIEEYLRYSTYQGLILPNEYTELTYVYHYIYLDYDHGTNINANSVYISNFAFNSALSDSVNVSQVTGYENYNYNEHLQQGIISNTLKDLYNSLVKPSNQDNTAEAQDMNDDIHEKEQVWYDNNSDALEAVGLSNYRFSQSQSSGITTAVTQFQAVWNALGNWTNVYIFILILSISTYIIRHEPTTRVKQYRSSVQAERAERISYYGRKNAESRASSSGSTFKNAIRRRK